MEGLALQFRKQRWNKIQCLEAEAQTRNNMQNFNRQRSLTDYDFVIKRELTHDSSVQKIGAVL